MSNKKKRQVKASKKYDNHVVGILSQKRVVNDDLSQSKVDVGLDKNSNGGDEIGMDKEVFGTKNAFCEKSTTSTKGTITVEMNKEVFGSNATQSSIPTVSPVCNKKVAVNTGYDARSPSPNDPNDVTEPNKDNEEVHVDNNSKPTSMNENSNDNGPNTANMSYAKAVNNVDNDDNKLMFTPTVISDDGNEFVIFDEDLMIKGSLKWNLTVCGYFVGSHMSANELNYHLRRMWSKFGLNDVKVNVNGDCFFKFKSEDGMNAVLKQGPWIVNNRPLFVQKWDPMMGMIRQEHNKIPIWAKLTNVPLEAWSKEGISALASSLGKPLIMDSMTTQICKTGMGKVDYARVLVEFEVAKGFKDKITVQYRNKENEIKGSKVVNVEYSWKPESCSFCSVFGHDTKRCTIRPKTNEEVEDLNKKAAAKVTEEEGFTEVKNRRGNQRVNGNFGKSQGGYNSNMDKNGGLWKEKNDTTRTRTTTSSSTTKENNVDKPTGMKKSIAENTTSNMFEVLINTKPKSYDDEFPAFPISQSQNVKMVNGVTNGTIVEDVCSGNNGISSRMVENSVRENEILKKDNRMEDPNIILQWEKELEFIDKLVDDKRIPNVEESKLWFKSTNQLLYYKKKWEVKWKIECPI